jgi:hypothetical protein
MWGRGAEPPGPAFGRPEDRLREAERGVFFEESSEIAAAETSARRLAFSSIPRGDI